jgi:excisionase family DNA binding protein
MSFTPCFLSVEEACKQLSISNSFFYLLVKRGQLRTVKLGRRTLVPYAELERLSSRQSSNVTDRTFCEVASTDIRPLVKAPKRTDGMEKPHAD